MRDSGSFIKVCASFLFFVLLEGVSLYMVYNNSIIQRSALLRGFNSLIASVSDAGTSVTDYFSLGSANRALARENSMLREKLLKMEKMMDELSLQEDTLLAEEFPSYKFIPAKVISNSTDNMHNYILIDKGYKDGIEKDMGVITSDGIVGYIVNTSSNYSKISSLLDVENHVGAVISKNNTFGTLTWNGKRSSYMSLNDIPIHTNVELGDTVTTSGFSRMYPPHHPIGTIEKISNNDGISFDLNIKLFGDFRSLKWVYVVSFDGKSETDSLLKENIKQK